MTHKHEYSGRRIDVGKRARVQICACRRRRYVSVVRCAPCGEADLNLANNFGPRSPCDDCHGEGYVDAPKDRTWLCPCCTGPADARCENCVNRSAAGMHVCTRESAVEVEYEIARLTMPSPGTAAPGWRERQPCGLDFT